MGKGICGSSNLNVVEYYNLLTGHFSPFVGAGVGLLAFDSGIPNGGNIYYWWDPYWGYTVSGGYTTHHSTHWTWNAAVGVRWDVTGLLRDQGVLSGDLEQDRHLRNRGLPAIHAERRLAVVLSDCRSRGRRIGMESD